MPRKVRFPFVQESCEVTIYGGVLMKEEDKLEEICSDVVDEDEITAWVEVKLWSWGLSERRARKVAQKLLVENEEVVLAGYCSADDSRKPPYLMDTPPEGSVIGKSRLGDPIYKKDDTIYEPYYVAIDYVDA